MKILLLVTALAFSGVITSTGFAQSINIQEAGSGGQVDMDLTSFSSLGDGNYTLSRGAANNWVNNLSDNSLASLTTSLPNFSNTGGGWVYTPYAGSSNIGNIWLANSSSLSNPGVLLGDPMIAYSVAFQNTTSADQTFTLTLSIPISPSATFNPSLVRSTVAGSVVDGGDANGFTFTPILPSTTGAGGAQLQTATLTTADGEVSTGTDLTSGTIASSVSGGNQIIGPITTPGYSGYIVGPAGTFTALTLRVGVTLSPGDFAALTGRVDVVPEPSTYALIVVGAFFIALGYRRMGRASL